MDGWNGRVCKNPAANTYCVGHHSYPGEMIAERRDLPFEQENAGACCSKLKQIPPCIYSLNAFGPKQLTAFADPPDFFKDGTTRLLWDLPPATVSVWPYEEMYGDDVKKEGGTFDYDLRLEKAKEFFADVASNRSLIFYYANYSNPLNTEDQRRYAVVGLSRVKKVGDIKFYENTSESVRERYGGGFIWQCDVTSHYPDEGLRLPYHLYLDRPEVLEKFAFFPDNPRNFKFGSRRVSDDDALDLVERFLEIANTLREAGDKSEDWAVRAAWLQQLIAELWESRGLYPGMAKILDVLGFTHAIPFWKQQVLKGKEKETRDAIFDFLDKKEPVPGLKVPDAVAKGVIRQWQLREDDERLLLREVFPRIDLHADQIRKVLSPERSGNAIYAPLAAIAGNPYLLSENFVGNGPDDVISFNKVDHGTYPSPELGGEALAATDDWRRLRGLCVEQLKREDKHAFVSAAQVIHEVNHKLSFLPEWKRAQFTERYLAVDEEELSAAITFRDHDGKKYLYWKPVYEDEREIERQVRSLTNRPDITFKSPVTESHWRDYLFDPDSVLAAKNPKEYEAAIEGQVEVCRKVFVRPVCVLSGAAGTGKTRVIRALIQAIEKAHGTGTSFQLLAPTGKAADRIREATGKPASTIHSFLAKLGWLNENMTFKRAGGKQEDRTTTYIVDEASMLDLGLAATLFRAINWKTVQRLILVGDPNQLPPIGRGRVFADVINWLRADRTDCIATLHTNFRQMENRLEDRGTGIVDLASLYVSTQLQAEDDEGTKARAEDMLRRVQEGGDVDKDLRVIYWNTPDDLAAKLVSIVVADMEADTGQRLDKARPFELWRLAAREEGGQRQRPEYLQIMSPYRGEQYGTDNLNLVVQRHIQGIDRKRAAGSDVKMLDGVMLFDKVIQVRNRPRSDPLWAWNTKTRGNEKVEVFNGELGFVKPHGLDGDKWKSGFFQLRQLQVAFARKEHLWVGYGGKADKVEDNLELAYAISVHKSQGSEFERVYFVVPRSKMALLSPELFYTGVTRARRHCTLLVEQDVSPLLAMRRRENSHLIRINSSLFTFRPLKDELLSRRGWYEEGKVHRTLTGDMVRSKSEVIIANMLFEREIPFEYEIPIYAPDGTFYLPDFTITWNGEKWFWEHWGLMNEDEYRNHTQTKIDWYNKHYPGRLVETTESTQLSGDADQLIQTYFAG